MILATGERARELCERPAWVRGIDHRIETSNLGARDLCISDSASRAAREAGIENFDLDFAELHAPFTHQELLLRRAMELPRDLLINPSGGALASNPMMVAGLTRVGEAARRIFDRKADRGLGHATSGPCLQQNLVCLLEGES